MKHVVDVPPIEVGLSKLKSFRADVSLEFRGQRKCEEAAGLVETQTVVDRLADALYRSTRLEGNLPNSRTRPGLTEFYQLNGRIYLNIGDESIWFDPLLDASLAPATLGLLDLTPWAVLPSVTATAPLTTTLDGVETRYYTFTQADLNSPQIAFEQAEGEMWVLQPENIVVNYVLSASIRTLTPLPSAPLIDSGQIQLSYLLSDIDQPVKINPPLEAKSNPLLTLPRPADAELTAVYPLLIEYTSASSPYSTTMFLRESLLTLDWTPILTDVFEEKARLGFAKNDQTATIIINPLDDDSGAKVVLDLNVNQ